MKTKMTIFSGLALFCFAAFATASDPESFEAAGKEYAAGHFKEAAALYQDRIDSKNVTAAVHYNLGNALFRAGEKGRALVAYERALRILPRDEDARWNLGVLKSVLVDRLEPEEGGLGSQLRFVVGFFTINEACLVLTAALAAFFAATLTGFLFPRLRAPARPFQAAAVLAAFLAMVFFGFKWLDVKDPRAVVLEKETFARYGPSEAEAKAFLLHEGAEARVLDEANGWLYVELPNKNSGWVRRDACEII